MGFTVVAAPRWARDSVLELRVVAPSQGVRVQGSRIPVFVTTARSLWGINTCVGDVKYCSCQAAVRSCGRDKRRYMRAALGGVLPGCRVQQDAYRGLRARPLRAPRRRQLAGAGTRPNVPERLSTSRPCAGPPPALPHGHRTTASSTVRARRHQIPATVSWCR